MPDNKLSVEDILEELQVERARRKGAPPVDDMRRIDEVIRDILTQKQEARLREEHRTPTEAEWANLKQEIEEQTRTLTQQFETQSREPPPSAPASLSASGDSSFPADSSVPAEEPAEDIRAPKWPCRPARRGFPKEPDEDSEEDVWEESAPSAPAARHSQKRSRRFARRDREREPEEDFEPEESPEPEEERELEEEREPASGEPERAEQPRFRRPFPERPYPGLERKVGEPGEKRLPDDLREQNKANSQHIRDQMQNITGHFGNFKMDDVSVEDVYLKTEITPSNYKEYKSSRHKRIENFVLGGSASAEAPEAAPEIPDGEGPGPEPETAAPFAREPRIFAPADFCEYDSPARADEVWRELRRRRNSCKMVLVGLGAVGLNALLFSFVGVGEGAVWLFGKFAVTPFLYALVNVVLLALALLFGRGVFRGARDARLRDVPTGDLFYAVAATVCLAGNVVFLIWPAALASGGAWMFTPVAVGMLFFAYVAKYQTARRALANFKFVAGRDGWAVRMVLDPAAARHMTKGLFDEPPVLAGNAKAAFFANFMARSFGPDRSDRILWRTFFVALPVSLLLGAGGWFFTKDVFTGISLLCGALVAIAGFLGGMLVALPLHDTSALLAGRLGGMTPDDGSIEEYRNVNAVLLEGADLFPGGSVTLHSIKTFQGKRVDDAILDGSSLCCAANSALAGMFLAIIGDRREILRPVDSIKYEDLMGMSAWVDERRVLLGNRDLMVNHSIAVPKPEYEDKYRADGGEVIYLAAEGELCAAFIVEFQAEQNAADVVRLLEKNGLAAVVRSMDASLTPELLGRVFGTEPGQFKVLPSRLHAEYEVQRAPREKAESMLGNNGTLFGYVVSLVAAKRLHRCIRLGAGLYWAAAVAGVALLAGSLVWKSMGGLGCLPILLVQTIFLLFYWIYEKNMRL